MFYFNESTYFFILSLLPNSSNFFRRTFEIVLTEAQTDGLRTNSQLSGLEHQTVLFAWVSENEFVEVENKFLRSRDSDQLFDWVDESRNWSIVFVEFPVLNLETQLFLIHDHRTFILLEFLELAKVQTFFFWAVCGLLDALGVHQIKPGLLFSTHCAESPMKLLSHFVLQVWVSRATWENRGLALHRYELVAEIVLNIFVGNFALSQNLVGLFHYLFHFHILSHLIIIFLFCFNISWSEFSFF